VQKRTAHLIVAFSVMALPISVLAEPLDQFDLTGLVVGAAGMVLGHELGHFALAASMDIDAEFDGVTVVYPGTDLSSQQQARVASAGFQSQWLLSELAFHFLDKPDAAPNSIAAGVVLGHLGITAAYLSFLKNEKEGDVAGMANAFGKNRTDLALLLAVPALLDGWRLFGKPPDWVPVLSRAGKGLGLAWIWSW
jgi:hypothetical protein